MRSMRSSLLRPTTCTSRTFLRALKSKVDVLCERPLSMTSRGVEHILAAAKHAGQKVVVGNNHRFRSDVQQLYRFLQGGELGRLFGVRAGQYQFAASRTGWIDSDDPGPAEERSSSAVFRSLIWRSGSPISRSQFESPRTWIAPAARAPSKIP